MNQESKTKATAVSWPAFAIGCIFLAAAFGFAIYAFKQQNLTEDQRSILLKWALPIASALASGAFAGSISVDGILPNGIRVGAIGGFAVWLISFFFIVPAQTPAQTLRVSQFNFLVETSATSDGVNTTLGELVRRSNRDYKIKSATDLKIAFGLVLEGFKVIDGRSTKVKVSVSILDQAGKELVSADVETFDTITEWTDLPNAKRIGAKNIIDGFSLSEGAVNSGLAMPMIILLDQFTESEIQKKFGAIRVRARDEYADRAVSYEERIGIVRQLTP